MPTVYCYGRASTSRQLLTEQNQRSLCEEFANRTLLPQGWAYGGWLYDSATSGSRPMFERDEGRKLWALVQPGDMIVWAKLDRAFRSVVDASQTMKLLQVKDVSFASLDLGLDTSTAIGRCVFTILTAFAELELEFIRERTRDGLRAKRRAGKPFGRHHPIGWQKVGKGKDSYYLPDQRERDQVDRMLVMRNNGHSLEHITLAMKELRPNGKRWNINSVTRAIKAGRARFPKEIPASPRRRSACA
ncbi:MAG: recombinase family protein [Betaproteobacteria bacterium]|nr:recombinase family protein [Betaproteobacteria bacterium]